MIITRTPYRLSLLGGGSDFPEWYRQHTGSVLVGTINKYCYLTLRHLPPFFPHRHRLVYSRIESVAETGEILHPAIREAFKLYAVDDGLELHHDGDLPARSGIGSSAAFAVGLVHALRLLRGLDCDPWTLASEAIVLETELLGEVGGHQDQVACAVGGFNHITFGIDGSISTESSSAMARHITGFSDWLVLLYSGQQRSSSEVSTGLKIAMESGDSPDLHELSSMAAHGRALLEQGDRASFMELGSLIHDSWRVKQSLNPRAVTPELQAIYDAGLAGGAIGGKIAGAGGGGFMLFCVPPEKRSSFLERMKALLHVPFRFVDHGSQALLADVATEVRVEDARTRADSWQAGD